MVDGVVACVDVCGFYVIVLLFRVSFIWGFDLWLLF